MPCLRIGLTGGIGSGKTTVSNLFAELGVQIIDADVLAHEITRNNHPALEQIRLAFGPEFIDAEGNLDRNRMRQRVFENPAERKRLEGILHPIIREEMNALGDACNDAYCIFSIPLLIEGGNIHRVDRILVIDADEARRRVWIKQRSGLSDAEIDGIFSAQVNREQRLAAADDVIDNNGTPSDLVPQVNQLHQKYMNLASRD